MKKIILFLLTITFLSCNSQTTKISADKVKSDLLGLSTTDWGKKSSCWRFDSLSEFIEFRINSTKKVNDHLNLDVKMTLLDHNKNTINFLHATLIYDSKLNLKRGIVQNCMRKQKDGKLLPELTTNKEERKFIGRWKTNYDSTILTINKYFEDYLTIVALSPTINGQHKGYLTNGSIEVKSYGVGLGEIIYNNETGNFKFAGMNFTKIE
ncbi:hypothetical protein [Bizionia sp.]|uniref:hypothetical protein n=1 Tax=Bizionia sp. TaxID=1954480 RepID=UPI003A913C60